MTVEFMETLQRFLAWYLGLRRPGPGEGTAWRFNWHLPEPHWLVLVASFVILLFVVGIYRREAAQLRSKHRLTLTALRLGVLAIILGLLTELSLTIERTGLPILRRADRYVRQYVASRSVSHRFQGGIALSTMSAAKRADKSIACRLPSTF